MNYSTKQDIIEQKRAELISVINEDFNIYEAVSIALEEHFMGIPFYTGSNNYKNDEIFAEEFNKAFLKSKHNRLFHNYGVALTEVFELLYQKQIRLGYVEIKKAVYAYMKKNKYESYSIEETESFTGWRNWLAEVICQDAIMDIIIDADWQLIVKPPKK